MLEQPVQSIVNAVEGIRQDQKQMFEAVLSRVVALEKDRKPDYSCMGEIQLLGELIKSRDDPEQIMQIQLALKEKITARGEEKKQKPKPEQLFVRPPTLTSTPSNLVSEAGRIDQIDHNAPLATSDRSRVVSAAADLESRPAPQRFMTGGEEPVPSEWEGTKASPSHFKKQMLKRTGATACADQPNLGARPKTAMRKVSHDDTEELTDDDRPSVDNTFESSFGSTRANRGSRSSLSLTSTEEKRKSVSFGEDERESRRKEIRQGRARERHQSLSRSPSPREKRETNRRQKDEQNTDKESSGGRKRSRSSPPSSDPDSDKDKKDKDKDRKRDGDKKKSPDKSRSPSPKKNEGTSPKARR